MFTVCASKFVHDLRNYVQYSESIFKGLLTIVFTITLAATFVS